MRKIIFRLHQIIGLMCSLTIMIALITGAMLIFEKELTELFHPERYEIAESNENHSLGYKALLSRLETQTGESVKSLTLRPEQNDTWIAETYESPKVRYFFNPADGTIVDRFIYGESFFFKVMALHRWLMVNPAGKIIMGISCIFFTIILLSGLWLWIPKSRKGLKARLTFKKNAGKKRKLFEWHVILGFYLLPFLLAMSVTGPTWSFPWYRSMLLNALGGEGEYSNKRNDPKPVADILDLSDSEWQGLLQKVSQLPAYNDLTIDLSGKPGKTDRIVPIAVNPKNAISHKVKTKYQYDIAADQLKVKESWSDLNKTTRLRYWFFALHTGSFFGLWTKWIYLFACLLASSLPVTGFILWSNKRKIAVEK